MAPSGVLPSSLAGQQEPARRGPPLSQPGSPRRPPRPQPQVSSRPSAVMATEWNLAALMATTCARGGRGKGRALSITQAGGHVRLID